MQLAGPWVMGPPADREGALAVLREAVALGITHIDTSDAYGPRVTNELIHEALHPYPESLHIVTKVGATRDEQGGWPTARRPEDLRRQVHDNLESLRLDVLDLVNLRLGNAEGPQPGSLAEAFETLVELQQQGLIRHLGISNATEEQVTEAQSIAPIVCVQNMYNLAHRHDDKLIDRLATDGVAYVPFFPLGGFTRFSPRRSRRSPLDWRRHRCPSHWPGCCSDHRTSCSSPARHRRHTCARTSPARDSPSLTRT